MLLEELNSILDDLDMQLEELERQLTLALMELEEARDENAMLWAMLEEMKEADKALMKEIVGLAMSEMTPNNFFIHFKGVYNEWRRPQAEASAAFSATGYSNFYDV